jgi:predicted nuclease of predicted toxin-antitoxin system
VKLLFDSNLSPDLVRLLSKEYPGSAHVLYLGLGPAPSDDAIWSYAAANDFLIVSKDADFYRLSTVNGPPPKVVWLRTGNGPTSSAEVALRSRAQDVLDLVADPHAALLILGRAR